MAKEFGCCGQETRNGLFGSFAKKKRMAAPAIVIIPSANPIAPYIPVETRSAPPTAGAITFPILSKKPLSDIMVPRDFGT